MQPTIIQDSISIAANSTNQNVIVSNPSLRGLLHAPYPCLLKLMAVQSAVGLSFDALHGSQMFASGVTPTIATFAQDPNHVINGDAYSQAQEQMVIRVTNNTAGALTFRYSLEMTPLVDESWNGAPIELPPDSVVMQSFLAIAAGAVDVQILDGLMFEQLSVPSMLKVLMTGSATGLLRQLFIDQDRVAPPSAISIANRFPEDPFDTTINGVEVPANARQSLMVSNPTAGPITLDWKTINKKLIRE